jgi:hypothetical protein
MTELKSLTQLRLAAAYTVADRDSGRPVLAMRWTIDATSGRPVCHWVTGHPTPLAASASLCQP